MPTKVSYEEIETNVVVPLEDLEEDIAAEFKSILELSDELSMYAQGSAPSAMRACVKKVINSAALEMQTCVDLYVAQLKTVTGEFATLDEAIQSQLGGN